jgi:hypothetical protein
MRVSIFKQIGLLMLVLSALVARDAMPEEQKLLDKAASGVKKGGEAAGRGIKKGAEATEKGLKKGGEATVKGVKKAGNWLGEKLDKVSK